MTAQRDLEQAYDPNGPILATDTDKRLDQLIRRHGGKPQPTQAPRKPQLPTPPRRNCKGQLAIGEDGGEQQ